MTKKLFYIITAIIITAAVLTALLLVFRPLDRILPQKDREQRQTRIIIPWETGADVRNDSTDVERMAYEDNINTRIALGDGEIMVAVLTQDFDGDPGEEQIIAYRNLLEMENPIYLAYVDYDEKDRLYKRIWDAPTAATRPGTISLYTSDLIGDRGICVLLTGMNGLGEHTMTIFRRNSQFQPNGAPSSPEGADQPFNKIAELRIDGSISIQETERSQAYRFGISGGQSFTIAAYGRDYESDNILDQVEATYTFNPGNGLYERRKITRVPGSQIEQLRLRELLSGKPGVFEDFINDLWYFVGPEGTLDVRQYIYFDPSGRELIFYGDETQQVFSWLNSSPTRYGLYISSQNISVTTLRRFLDIELESLDSIKVKIFEDVRLKIGVSASWDGSYRRAETARIETAVSPLNPYVDAVYNSSMGKIQFFKDGNYELSAGGTAKKGRYAFFRAGGEELLELRAEESPETAVSAPAREIYRIENTDPVKTPEKTRGNMILSRIRLGAIGIQDLHEGAITLTAAEEDT
jgi:hypothetical protein